MNYSGHIRKRTTKGKETSYQIIIEMPIDDSTGKRKRKYIMFICVRDNNILI